MMTPAVVLSCAKVPDGPYMVRCDDCKDVLRWTQSLRESAAGGRCAWCKVGA